MTEVEVMAELASVLVSTAIGVLRYVAGRICGMIKKTFYL